MFSISCVVYHHAGLPNCHKFAKQITRLASIFSGDYIEGETPVPIPNTAVKPLRADGTRWVTVWESRSLPGVI